MNEKQGSIAKNSTVAISSDDTKRLERFCQTNGITKKDFISLSLSYFEKQGINPAKHESPKVEMEKVTKRLDQFFAFMKKQEQDILRPMYAEQISSNRKIVGNQVIIIKNQSLLETVIQSEVKELKPLFTKLDSLTTLTKSESERLQKGLEELLQLVDEKNKSGLMGKLFG